MNINQLKIICEEHTRKNNLGLLLLKQYLSE